MLLETSSNSQRKSLPWQVRPVPLTAQSSERLVKQHVDQPQKLRLFSAYLCHATLSENFPPACSAVGLTQTHHGLDRPLVWA